MSDKVLDLFRLDSLDVIKGFITNTDPELEYWFEAEMNHRDLDLEQAHWKNG